MLTAELPTRGGMAEDATELSERLREAAGEGRVDAVRVLVEQGADVHAQDQDGDAPLHLAARKGHGEVVKVLVELGADTQARDAEGRTPAFYSTDPQVKALLQRRATAASQPQSPGPR